MTTKLGLGIIGTGWGVNIQIPAFRLCGLEISGLWTRTEDKSNEFSEKLKIPLVTSDYNQLLSSSDIRLISIVSPPFLHRDQAIAAFKAGKHVLCDKPFVMNPSEARELINISKQYPNQLAIIDHELRFLPVIQLLRKVLIEQKLIGKIKNIDVHLAPGIKIVRSSYNWWSDKALGGGILGATGTHVIDLMTFLTGQKIVKVNALMNTYQKQKADDKGIMKEVTSDDYCSFFAQFDGAILANVSITPVHGRPSQNILIEGESGTARLDLREGHLQVYNSENKEIINHKDDYPAEYKGNAFGTGTTKLGLAIKEFLENEQQRNSSNLLKYAATFEDGLYVQTVIEAVRFSSDLGKWIEVKQY